MKHLNIDSKDSEEVKKLETEKDKENQEAARITGPIAKLKPGKMNSYGNFVLKSDIDLDEFDIIAEGSKPVNITEQVFV